MCLCTHIFRCSGLQVFRYTHFIPMADPHIVYIPCTPPCPSHNTHTHTHTHTHTYTRTHTHTHTHTHTRAHTHTHTSPLYRRFSFSVSERLAMFLPTKMGREKRIIRALRAELETSNRAYLSFTDLAALMLSTKAVPIGEVCVCNHHSIPFIHPLYTCITIRIPMYTYIHPLDIYVHYIYT